MRTSLRKMGNSREIIIPAALLAACEMVDEVDIKLEGNHLVIAQDSPCWLVYKPDADSEPHAAMPCGGFDGAVWFTSQSAVQDQGSGNRLVHCH